MVAGPLSMLQFNKQLTLKASGFEEMKTIEAAAATQMAKLHQEEMGQFQRQAAAEALAAEHDMAQVTDAENRLWGWMPRNRFVVGTFPNLLSHCETFLQCFTPTA